MQIVDQKQFSWRFTERFNHLIVFSINKMAEDFSRISQVLIPSTENTYRKLIDVYSSEKRDLEQMNGQIEELLMQLNNKVSESNSNINDLKKKASKNELVLGRGQKFLDGKAEQMKGKNKIIESIVSSLKEAVSKISPKKLAELPVEKQRCLSKLFEMLFCVLYCQNKKNFNWKDFKVKALEHQKGEDFQSRMANINVRTLKQEDYKSLMEMKADTEFEKLCEKQKHSAILVEMWDWMEYVCVGYAFHHQKEGASKDFLKIKNDMERRTAETKQATESLEFWKETLAETEQFQNNLLNIQKRMKTIQIGMGQAIGKLSDAVSQSREKWAKVATS